MPFAIRRRAAESLFPLRPIRNAVSQKVMAASASIVEFSDTGCGIRPDQMDHIFEPGFSGNGDTSGLGLAVCAADHEAARRTDFAFRTKFIRGARFTIYFPILQMEVGDSMNQRFFEERNSSVLVVDDEPGMRTALRANFLRHGWRVETATGVARRGAGILG